MTQILIIGCGDVGSRVARQWRRRGFPVDAVVHSDASAGRLRDAGVRARASDLDDPAAFGVVPADDAVIYYFAPPPTHGTGDPRLEGFLTLIQGSSPRQMIYISTSGVYGDCGGAWVNEDTPTNPVTDRARRRWAAEQRLRQWSADRRIVTHILRVPGIYGPGRLPLERIRQGHPVVDEGDAPYTNRIHVDDLAQVCVVCAERCPAGAVFNVSDGHPSTMTDYFNRVADAFGLPRPPAVSLAQAREHMTPAMYSFWRESRRLDNHRMLEMLGIELMYPTLEAGLADCVARQ
jgi:nucleoside-diphosphate-sugar epimerase